MKKSKKNYLVIALVVMLIALAVGYAAFSTSLNINGTATATKDWDIHFENPAITTAGATDTATLSTVTSTNDTLTVSVTLDYPGHGKTISVDIANDSTATAAKLTGFTVTGTGDTTLTPTGNQWTDGEVTITVPTMTTENAATNLAAGQTGSFDFTVVWDADSTVSTRTVTFQIGFTYAQDTTNFNGTPNWEVN